MLRNLNKSTGGRRILGTPFVGLPGSLIIAETAVGDNGPGLLYAKAMAFPSQSFRVRITTPPASGALFVYENGAFLLEGAANGTYNIAYDWDRWDGATLVSGSDTSLVQVGMTSVDNSHTLSYGIKNSVIAEKILSYNVSQAVANTLAFNYEILAASTVANSLNISYSVFNSVNSSLDVSYNLNNVVASSFVVSYETRQSVAADMSLAFNLLNINSVGSSLDLSYELQSYVNNDQLFVYDTFGSIASSLVLGYSSDDSVIRRVLSVNSYAMSAKYPTDAISVDTYMADIGTELLVNCDINLSQALSVELHTIAPDGSKSTLMCNRIRPSTIQYIFTGTDFAMQGVWQIQPYIVSTSWAGHSSPFGLVALPAI